MCDYCKNYFTGDDWTPLISAKGLGCYQTDVSIVNFLDQEGTAKLELCATISNGTDGIDVIPTAHVSIHYCPICGTKLEGAIR